MSVYSSNRRRSLPYALRIEELENRTLMSLSAASFSENVLNSTASTIEPARSSRKPTRQRDGHVRPRLDDQAKGGQLSINPASGLVQYMPGSGSPASDSFQYFATDSDANTSAIETVTLSLGSVAANPVSVSELEGQATIRSDDPEHSGSRPGRFEQAELYLLERGGSGAGNGAVSLTKNTTGALTYTLPSNGFTGAVIITYQVTDGTGDSASKVEIDLGPIAADPVTWGTLRPRRRSLRRPFRACSCRSMSSPRNPTYTFSKPVVAPGDGTVSNLDPATGDFTYTAPDAAFTGIVPVNYTVSDGTNSTTGNVSIVVAPLVTQPVSVHRNWNTDRRIIDDFGLAGAVKTLRRMRPTPSPA